MTKNELFIVHNHVIYSLYASKKLGVSQARIIYLSGDEILASSTSTMTLESRNLDYNLAEELARHVSLSGILEPEKCDKVKIIDIKTSDSVVVERLTHDGSIGDYMTICTNQVAPSMANFKKAVHVVLNVGLGDIYDDRKQMVRESAIKLDIVKDIYSYVHHTSGCSQSFAILFDFIKVYESIFGAIQDPYLGHKTSYSFIGCKDLDGKTFIPKDGVVVNGYSFESALEGFEALFDFHLEPNLLELAVDSVTKAATSVVFGHDFWDYVPGFRVPYGLRESKERTRLKVGMLSAAYLLLSNHVSYSDFLYLKDVNNPSNIFVILGINFLNLHLGLKIDTMSTIARITPTGCNFLFLPVQTENGCVFFPFIYQGSGVFTPSTSANELSADDKKKISKGVVVNIGVSSYRIGCKDLGSCLVVDEPAFAEFVSTYFGKSNFRGIGPSSAVINDKKDHVLLRDVIVDVPRVDNHVSDSSKVGQAVNRSRRAFLDVANNNTVGNTSAYVEYSLEKPNLVDSIVIR